MKVETRQLCETWMNLEKNKSLKISASLRNGKESSCQAAGLQCVAKSTPAVNTCSAAKRGQGSCRTIARSLPCPMFFLLNICHAQVTQTQQIHSTYYKRHENIFAITRNLRPMMSYAGGPLRPAAVVAGICGSSPILPHVVGCTS